MIEQDVRWVQIRDQNPLLSLSPYGRPAQPDQFAGYFWMRDSSDPKVQFLWRRRVASTRPDPSDAGMAYVLASGDEGCDPAKLKRLIQDRDRTPPVSSRKQVRIEAENFRHLEGFAIENRSDRVASHRLSVKLTGGASGSIRTWFDEPFASKAGAYDVVVRYLDANGERCRFAFFVNGAARGSRWESSGEGRGWTSQTLQDVAIQLGDEVRLAAEAPDARLDYVQLNGLSSP